MAAFRWLAPFALVLSLGGFVDVARASAATTVDEIVAGVQSTYKNVSSVRANFVQTTRNPITGKDEKKSGRILMERPRKMRIEVGMPMESAVVSDGATLWIYAAAQKQVIVQKETSTGAGLGVLLDDLGRLAELFDVSVTNQSAVSTVHTVNLVPKTAGQYKSVQITFTKDKYLLQELVLVDQTDGRTEMDFTGIVMGGDIADTNFSFKAPAGVTVVDASKM